MNSLFTTPLTGSCGLLLLFADLNLHASELSVTSEVLQISITARNAGTKALRLPELQSRFVLTASCDVGFEAETVSLGIADSRKAVSAAEIPAAGPFELTLTVPATQVGPVAVHSFCATASGVGAAPHESSLLVPAVVSAQLALTCANASDRRITYVSESVDVLLICEQERTDSDTDMSDSRTDTAAAN